MAACLGGAVGDDVAGVVLLAEGDRHFWGASGWGDLVPVAGAGSAGPDVAGGGESVVHVKLILPVAAGRCTARRAAISTPLCVAAAGGGARMLA
jgi:hypothetical protein